jgi:hypothetical protein
MAPTPERFGEKPEKIGKIYCLEARRDSSAHSNSVRTLVTTLSGGGMNGAARPGARASPVVRGGGGMGGGLFELASSRHLTIFPGLLRK